MTEAQEIVVLKARIKVQRILIDAQECEIESQKMTIAAYKKAMAQLKLPDPKPETKQPALRLVE